jgi:hypothetical protein
MQILHAAGNLRKQASIAAYPTRSCSGPLIAAKCRSVRRFEPMPKTFGLILVLRVIHMKLKGDGSMLAPTTS